MITYGEVEKLRSSRAADQSVLSLYVYVPPDSAGLRQLQARAADLIEAATEGTPDTLHREDEMLARRTLGRHTEEWLGHTLGIFVSEQLSLLDVVPLPGRFAERAVLAARPHLRPILAALERYPDHRIVVIDHRHAWLITVAGDRIEVVARVPAESAPSAAFGGWYLEPSDSRQRVTELAAHSHQDAAAILDRQARYGSSQPLVIGGHADSIMHLLALLPRAVLTEYAGGFAADPRALTLAGARERGPGHVALGGTARAPARRVCHGTAARHANGHRHGGVPHRGQRRDRRPAADCRRAARGGLPLRAVRRAERQQRRMLRLGRGIPASARPVGRDGVADAAQWRPGCVGQDAAVRGGRPAAVASRDELQLLFQPPRAA